MIEQPLEEAIDSTPLPSVMGAPSAADATGDDPAPIAYEPALESADACDCEACGSSCDWDAGVVPACWADNLSILGGVHGFRGPANRGGDSSFGFQAGFNYGTPARNIVLPPTMGLQIGFQTNYSNFEGSAFTASDRQQMFLTTGVFRRVDQGFEGGLVYDYLWDDWYYNIGVSQLRGALGLSLTEWNTVGFWFTSSVSTDTTTSQLNDQRRDESWETVDIYALYFRSQTIAAGSGEGRLFGGFTGDGDGIIGADSKLPLHNGWAIETAFTYLIPQQDAAPFAQEAWNVGINLVWYPGSLACGNGLRYHRPLFDVADNGSMILRQAD